MSTESPPPEPEPSPEPVPDRDPNPTDSPKPPSDYIRTATFVYDTRGRLTEIKAPSDCGGNTTYSYDSGPPFSFEWKHLPDKRLYSLTAEGKTEYWRDNPTLPGRRT